MTLPFGLFATLSSGGTIRTNKGMLLKIAGLLLGVEDTVDVKQ